MRATDGERVCPALRWVLLAALLPALARPLGAQDVGAARAARLVVDNDLLSARVRGRPPDFDYTHGTRVELAWAGAPQWVRRVAGGPGTTGCRHLAARQRGCVSSAIAVVQQIYTPRRDAPQPVAGERPYAGWLSLSATATAVLSTGHTRSVRAEVGVTGPGSLAEQVQDGVHRLLHNQPQLGWAHQLGSRPGIALTYDEVLATNRRMGSSGAVTVGARWGGTVGDVRGAIWGGAEATAGLGDGDRWSPAEPGSERRPRLYVLAVVKQEVVQYDVFVEGRGSTPGATRRPLVPQGEAGVGYRWRTAVIEYRHVVRGREYRSEPTAHRYGSLAVVLSGR